VMLRERQISPKPRCRPGVSQIANNSWGVESEVSEAENAQDQLLTRARRGDHAAFGQLVVLYRKRIFALALHLSGNASDAEDIVQETFLRAYRHVGEFEGRSQFATWLYRIALNRAFSHKRRAGADRVRLDDDRVRAAIAVDASGDPQQAAQLAESYAHLLTAVDALSPSLRATVVLVAVQGMSHREAALACGTSEGTIAWRMHEARKQLQHALARPARARGTRPSADDVSQVRNRRPSLDAGVRRKLRLGFEH
jgi:RNA polymerase sigma-70 factor (ECF subfamily)